MGLMVNNSCYLSGIYYGQNTLTPTSKVRIIPQFTERAEGEGNYFLAPITQLVMEVGSESRSVRLQALIIGHFGVNPPPSEGPDPLPKHKETME